MHALPLNHGFDDVVCVTDRPDDVPDGWRVVAQPLVESPRLEAKKPKMMPWLFTDCDAAVWLDASFEITGDLSGWVRPLLERNEFLVWQHPEGRVCLEQEAAVCWFFPKYRKFPVLEQAESYLANGMPRNWGLFACGMVGWRFSQATRDLGQAWFGEQKRWSPQDQISLPYLLWDSGMRYGLWPANEYQNAFVRLRWDLRPQPQL